MTEGSSGTALARTDDQAGTIVRQGMDGQSIERRDPAAVAMAEKQRAMVQARIVQAIQRPRDVLACRAAILEDCKREGFAKAGIYHVPRGQKQDPATGKWVPNIIEGLSIRFAETAARHFRNLVVEQVVIHDSARLRVIQVAAMDLENNFSTSMEISVEKTIERKKLKQGQTPLAMRENSYGETVYILEAGEDEFAVKIAAALSKARRNVILQVIPGDVLDDAREAIERTISHADKEIPIAEQQRRCADFFMKIGVGPEKLAEYFGHALGEATAEELATLRLLGAGIRDGETTWREVMAAQTATGEPDAAGEVKQAAESPAAFELRAKLAAKAAEKKARKAAPAAVPVAPPAPVASGVDEAALLREQIADMSAETMGAVGGQLAAVQNRKPVPEWFGPVLAEYQAKRRTIEA